MKKVLILFFLAICLIIGGCGSGASRNYIIGDSVQERGATESIVPQ
jgi:hypothetical protein